MINRIKQLFQDEHGAATIIEYALVLPVVMAIIMILMLTGYIIYERAALESAAERSALYISKCIADPNYPNLVSRDGDINEITSISFEGVSILNQPYRYLFPQKEGTITNMANDAKSMVRGILDKTQLMKNNVDIDVSIEKSFISSVTVEVTEVFEVPTLLPVLKLPSVEIHTIAVAYVDDPAELIRNADFVIDLAEKLDEKLGISDKVNEVISQIKILMD